MTSTCGIALHQALSRPRNGPSCSGTWTDDIGGMLRSEVRLLLCLVVLVPARASAPRSLARSGGKQRIAEAVAPAVDDPDYIILNHHQRGSTKLGHPALQAHGTGISAGVTHRWPADA